MKNEPMPGIEASELAEVDPVLQELEAAFELIQKEDEHWLPNWYLGQVNSIDACREKMKEQYGKMLQALDNRRKQLEYRWGAEFRAEVNEDIASHRGKKRSFDYLQGRSGYRAGKDKLVVNDEKAAIEWADNGFLECAIKVTQSILKTPLMDHFKATGEVPDGCEIIEATDKFYPTVSKRLLPGPTTRGMLEGEA